MIFEGNAKDCVGLAGAFDGPILDCLPLEVVVVDSRGVVLAANAKWKGSAHPVLAGARRVAVGDNLVDAIRACGAADRPLSTELLEGLEALLAGDRAQFACAYPVDSSGREYFSLTAARMPQQRGAIVISRRLVDPEETARERSPPLYDEAGSPLPAMDKARALAKTDRTDATSESEGRFRSLVESEAALRESENRFRSLFEKMDEGYCIVEVLFEDGRAVDFRFLEANPAFEKQCGLSNAIGRRMREIEPALEARWFETYGKVAQTGEPIRFGAYSEALARYFDVYAFCVGAQGDNKVAILFTDVTQRKAAEDARRESEERQAFLVDLIDGVRQIDDPEEIQRTACRLLCEHLGVSRVYFADAEGQEYGGCSDCRSSALSSANDEPPGGFGKALIGAHRRGCTVAIGNVLEEGGLSPSQLDGFREAGVAAVASVMVVKGGRRVGALSACSATPRAWTPLELDLIGDVAERIWSAAERARAIAALHESEFRLQLALLSGNIGIYEWRPGSNEMLWDDQLRAQWRLPADAPATFEAFMEGIHPADRARVQAAVDQALDPGRGRLSVEFRLGAGALSDRWIAATGTVFFRNNRAVRVVGTAQDITERKSAEAERQKFVSLAEQSMEFIGICNMDFEPIYINRAGIQLVGLKGVEDALGRKVGDFFFPEDRPFIEKEFFPRVVREGHANVEIRFRRFDTSEALWMLYNVFFLRGPDGEPIGLATVSRDITERRRAEDALKAADRRKDEFLATLAHELRNPLVPIRNAVHVLRHVNHPEASPKSKRELTVLSMIDRQVDHLIRLVDDLLEVSRITRGKIELKKQRVDLADVLRHAIEMSQPMIDRAGHELHVELPDDPIECEADPVRLEQVFTNLLNNAAKYTEPGGRITLVVERQGDEAVAVVRDTGVGIPVEMLPRVFDLFTQVDRTLGRAQGGLGIGLALVKNLLELQGGTVQAQSEGLGRGSAFIVRLPSLPKNNMEERMVATSPTEVGAARKVLVIDDDHDVADSLVMFLETFGATVHVAYGGAEGLEAIKGFKPELVFLDLGMPGMDGYETARRIRAAPEGRDVKLIALTGWGQDQIRDRARAAGFDMELTKPAGLEALQGLLASV